MPALRGTKRPASFTTDPDPPNSHQLHSSKRLKPNSPPPLDSAATTTAGSSWIKPWDLLWQGVHVLLAANSQPVPPPAQASGQPLRSAPSHSRLQPRPQPLLPNGSSSAASSLYPSLPSSAYTDLDAQLKQAQDEWKWSRMLAKGAGKKEPEKPSVLRELEAAKKARGGKAVNGRGDLFRTAPGSSVVNGVATGSGAHEGEYRRKRPMGSLKVRTAFRPACARPQRYSKRRIRPPSPVTRPPKPTSPTPPVKRAPIASFPASPSPTSRPATVPLPSRYPKPPWAPLPSASPPASPPSAYPSSARSASPSSAPWTPLSSSSSASTPPRFRRNQHQSLLRLRDQSTLESLRSTPSMPSDSVDSLDLHDYQTEEERQRDELRLYRLGVDRLKQNLDKFEPSPLVPVSCSAASDSLRKHKPVVTTSSLLAPPTTSYASVVASASKSPRPTAYSNGTPSRSRPISRLSSSVDRALQTYKATLTESPVKALASQPDLLENYERLRAALEEAELSAADLDVSSSAKVQKRRVWPKKLPKQLQDRLDTIMRDRKFEKFLPGASVDADALRRLKGLTWLNDDIVVYYGVMINRRLADAEKKGDLGQGETRLKKSYAMNSHWWTMYGDHGYARVKKWTKKFDVFAKDIIIFPVNLNNSHWSCAAINLEKKRFEYYDSFGGELKLVYKRLRKWLTEEHAEKKKAPLDLSDWTDHWDTSTPQQGNSSDCGVFTCAFMESLSRGVEGFDFTQENMPYLRGKIALEIDKQELMPIEEWK
ncbi:hypothetical protein JCM1841_000512 [Sporobolomyces salmonicolor]